MRLLVVNSHPLDYPGGAELSLKKHLDCAPEGIEAEFQLPDDDAVLEEYDTVLLANLRPPGGLGEQEEFRWAEEWSERLAGYGGHVVKVEYDVNPCGYRNGNCFNYESRQPLACPCSRLIPDAFERLYNLCDELIFLSPLQKEVIESIVTIRGPRVHLVAPPVDIECFRPTKPFTDRKPTALVTGDANRVSPEVERLAASRGYAVEYMDYLSAPYETMPSLLNRYQAVVVAPSMLHAFARLVVEAMLCGCEVITNDRVGAMSWPDPVAASREANEKFWTVLTERNRSPNRRRMVGHR